MMNQSVRYGGFWRRLAAFLLDFAFHLPLMLIFTWGARRFQYWDLYQYMVVAVLSLIYSVYIVQRFGGTPGKLLMGLRIRRLDGSKVGYREALLRFLPEYCLWIAFAAGAIAGLFAIADAQDLRAFDFIERTTRLRAAAPSWLGTVEIVQQLWILSEFLVLLTNRKRRALHDFLAGTAVVVQEKAVAVKAAA